MTDSTRGTGAAPGPPWSVDVLADLHAGALDARQSAQLWARVNHDPDAQAILAALDSVRHDLDALGTAPVEPMPARFAAQLDAAVAAEAAKSRPAQAPQALPQGMAPVVDMAEARRRRNRRTGWVAGVLTAAAAAVAVTFVALPGEKSTDGSPIAEDGGGTTSQEDPAPGNEPPLALKSDDLGAAVSQLTGHDDYGPFGDEEGFADCLDEQGVEDPQVIGAREVSLDGEQGVAGLLAGGAPDFNSRFRLVVVDPSCTELITNTPLG